MFRPDEYPYAKSYTMYDGGHGYKEWREYDEKGNLIHTKNTDGDEEFYKYNECGLFTYRKFTNGNYVHEEWFECAGNRYISSKDSDNRHTTYEYDENGHCVYANTRDADGDLYFEEWYDYDEYGHCVHYSTSDDIEEWYDYDGDNLVYYKDSDGFKRWYKYDDDDNCIYTYSNDGCEFSFEYDEYNRCIKVNSMSMYCGGSKYYYHKIDMDQVNKEFGTQTKLHVVFVNFDGRIVDEIIVPCFLNRDTDMPYILINDVKIKDIIAPEGRLDFYDKKKDRFNFKSSNVTDLECEKDDVPDELVVEILRYSVFNDKKGFYNKHQLLSPGLWQTDEDGTRYRMCDDAILYIINKTHVPELEQSCEDKNADCTWKDLFFEAFRELHLIFMEPDEEYEDEDDEFECDGVCFACDNEHCFDHPNHESKNVINDEDNEDIDENGKLLKNSYYRTGAHIKDEKDDNRYTKCDRCNHRKECEEAKAEFSTKKLYHKQMIMDDIDKTSLIPIKMIRVRLKPSSKRKHRKY